MERAFSEVFVAIAAPDPSVVVQFYETVFSCPPTLYQRDRYAEFQLAGLRLGIFKPSPAHESEFPAQPSSFSLCVEVEQLDETIQHLKTANIATPSTITAASHGREIYIYDPLGNRLILHESSS